MNEGDDSQAASLYGQGVSDDDDKNYEWIRKLTAAQREWKAVKRTQVEVPDDDEKPSQARCLTREQQANRTSLEGSSAAAANEHLDRIWEHLKQPASYNIYGEPSRPDGGYGNGGSQGDEDVGERPGNGGRDAQQSRGGRETTGYPEE